MCHGQQQADATRAFALRARDCGACGGAQHIDASSLEVVAQLVGALREDDAGAHDSKLFVLLAVRSTEGIVDEQMRGWVEDVPFVTHMEVGELLPEAARKLAILSTPGGRLPDDVLDYLVVHCEGVCLNIEQMATAFVESELLFLTGAKPTSSRFAQIRTSTSEARRHVSTPRACSRPAGPRGQPRGHVACSHGHAALNTWACRCCRALAATAGDGVYELEGDIGKIALPTNLARGDAPPMHAWSRSKRGPCGSIAAAAVVCTAHHMALFSWFKLRARVCEQPPSVTRARAT